MKNANNSKYVLKSLSNIYNIKYKIFLKDLLLLNYLVELTSTKLQFFKTKKLRLLKIILFLIPTAASISSRGRDKYVDVVNS